MDRAGVARLPDARVSATIRTLRTCPWGAARKGSTVGLLEYALVTIPFRSEIMELPLVGLTMLFCFGALVILGRWWER